MQRYFENHRCKNYVHMIHVFTHDAADRIDFGVPGYNEDDLIYILGSSSHVDGDISQNISSGEVSHIGDVVAADTSSYVGPSM